MSFIEIKNTLETNHTAAVVKLKNDYYKITICYVGDYANDKKSNCIDENNIMVSCKAKNADFTLRNRGRQVYINMMSVSCFIPDLYTTEDVNKVRKQLDIAESALCELQQIVDKYFANDTNHL